MKKQAAPKKDAPPRAPKVTPHESYVLAIDVGSGSLQKDVDQKSDLAKSQECVDWILSRKIFTDSKDLFTLMSFGNQGKQNKVMTKFKDIEIHQPEFETARVEWLRMLESGLGVHKRSPGDYIGAMYVALELLKQHNANCAPKELLGLNVTLMSNLAGLESTSESDLHSLVKRFRDIGAKLWVIGPDLSSKPSSKAQEVGFNFINRMLKEVEGSVAMSFDDGLSQLNYFVPKFPEARGIGFELELGPGFSIAMQMYLKTTDTKMISGFDNVATSSEGDDQGGVELKKVRRYEAVGDNAETTLKYTDIDKTTDETFVSGKRGGLPTAKFVEKDEIIKGYRYGSSVIPVGKDEQMIVDCPKGRKQLSLIQFTKKENILPQFILSNCRYFLPKPNDDNALAALSAMVKAMLEQGVVAIARYAFNVNANPRVVCLIPKITNAGLPVLIHYMLPFNEDLRNFDFPNLNQIGQNPTEYQLDLVDAYIDYMDLGGHDGIEERMRCKEICNPKHQYQCQIMRAKALHPDSEPNVDRNKILEQLSPPADMLENATSIIEDIKEKFQLEKNQQARAAAFKTVNPEESVANANGVAKTEDDGLAQINKREEDVAKFEMKSEN